MDKSKSILSILDRIHTRSEGLLKDVNDLDKEIYNDILNGSRLLKIDAYERAEKYGRLQELLTLRMDIMNLISEGVEA